MLEIFDRFKELAKKKGCNIRIQFTKAGDNILFFDFGSGNHIAFKIPDSVSDEADIDDFMKDIEHSLDLNLVKLKNNHNLNVILDEVDGLIDSYTGACTMCDDNDCSDCNIQRFSDELRSLSKTILKLKDK